MDELTDHLDRAADALAALSRDLPTLAVAPGAFATLPATTSTVGPATGGAPKSASGSWTALAPGGAGSEGPPAGSGLPGQVGRALHDHWAAVLDARAHEASAASGRLAELARSVRVTRRHYAETDEAVERRFSREM